MKWLYPAQGSVYLQAVSDTAMNLPIESER